MSRLNEVRLAHKIVPTLQYLLGSKLTRHICNRIVGEDWVFVRDIFDPEIGKLCKRGFILLPGGCNWDGCTFCPYKAGVEKYVGQEPVTEEEFKLLFDLALPLVEDCEVLEIWTGGSFFWEIPKAVQQYILEQVGRTQKIRKLRVESLPAFIDEDKIAQAKNLLHGRQLDVAIGFETQDDELRKALGKLGVMQKAQYVKAVALLNRLGVRSSAYVMLKPTVMLESSAVAEAIQTLKYVFSVGTNEALLQAAFVADGTPLKKDWLARRYTPPSLWSVLSVLKATQGCGPIYLGEFQDSPPPLAGPTSCSECKPVLLRYFAKYRRTLRLGELTNAQHCQCHSAWEAHIGKRLDPHADQTIGGSR